MAIWLTKKWRIIGVYKWLMGFNYWLGSQSLHWTVGLPSYLPFLSCFFLTVSDKGKHIFLHGISLVSSLFISLGFAALMFLAVNFSCFMIVLSVMLSKNQESNQKIHRLIIVCSVPRNLLAPLFVPVRIGLTIALVKNTI